MCEVDPKQEKLNKAVERDVRAAGGHNYIQARYGKEVCRAVLTCDSDKFDFLLPDVNSSEDKAWTVALKLSMAFLRRYKMDTTLTTIRMEQPAVPRHSGFSKASDVDATFARLLKTRKQ